MAASRSWRVAVSVALVALLSGAGAGTPRAEASSPYLLPLPSGTHVLVTGGNGGYHTGWEAYAWDFALFGSSAEFPVVAARGGTVIGLQAAFKTSQHCLDDSCWTKANYVLVDQGDKTSALYMHLAENSVKVSLGQKVVQGQPLGDADNTGWSTGNHLHFQVEATPAPGVVAQAKLGKARDGWWFTQSMSVAFSDPALLARNSDGIPTYVDSFPGGYVSSNGENTAQPITSTASSSNTAGAASASLSLPFTGTWYLTGGPHSDGLSGGVRYALDFAPKEAIGCPGGSPLVSDIVVAADAGSVTAVDDGTGASSATHSVVEVTDTSGLTTGYMHLANIDVQKGQHVDVGTPLGNPSCEIPKGGATTGIHLHFYLKRAGKPVAIAGTTLDGWVAQAATDNYQGSLGKNGQTRTADTRRCPAANPCGSIINEIASGTAAPPVAPPPPPVANGWQTYQGDGYVVDYPGPAKTESVPSSQNAGLYSATASYYSTGPEADPQVVYMVEHFKFPFSVGSLGLDYTTLLKDTLSFYSLTSGDPTMTQQDVTIDGHNGLLISLRGDGVTGEFEVLWIDSDLHMVIAAHKTTDTTMDSQRFFDSFHVR